MNPEDAFLDFLRRTKENLATTDKWRDGDPSSTFHEVTNLVNSLLGLIVLPQELLPNSVRQVEVGPHGIAKWGVTFNVVKREGRPPKQLRPLLTGMRNTIAHGSWEFEANGPNIGGIKFVNRSKDRKRVLWIAAFDLDGLHSFLDHLTSEIERAYRRQGRILVKGKRG